MAEQSVNTITTAAIDAAGEIARYKISATWAPAITIGLNIDADAICSFAVDIGGRREDGSVYWFEDEIQYTDTNSVRDSWIQTEEWMRIRVTNPAVAASEATVYVARGD